MIKRNLNENYQFLKINKEKILEKYDLGYEYEYEEAPKELLAVDK